MRRQMEFWDVPTDEWTSARERASVLAGVSIVSAEILTTVKHGDWGYVNRLRPDGFQGPIRRNQAADSWLQGGGLRRKHGFRGSQPCLAEAGEPRILLGAYRHVTANRCGRLC